jgi:hypothetical protein
MFQFLTGAITSESNIPAQTNLTFRLVGAHPATVSSGAIWSASGSDKQGEDPFIEYGTNIIRIGNVADRHEDQDIWTFPVTASAWDDIMIAFTANSNATPLVSKNGATVTVTKIQSNTGLTTMATAPWSFGAGTTNLGYLGGIGAWSSKLTQAQMNEITSKKQMHAPWFSLNKPTLLYLGTDDFPVGETAALATNLDPTADVQNTWNFGTYSNLITSDNIYLKANKSDDNETYICDLDTVTPPSGYSFYYLKTSLEGNIDDTAQPTSKLTLGSGGGDLSSWVVPFASSDTTRELEEYGAYTQAQIDGLRLNLSVGTMSKDDAVHIDRAYVKAGYRRSAIKDWLGSYDFRAAPSAVLSVGLSGAGWGY